MPHQNAHRAWGFMHARGTGGLPPTIDLAGRTWRLTRTVKHDFFAATGFYRDDAGGEVVAKFGRRDRGLRWLGRLVSRREARFLRKLGGVAGVPTITGLFDGDTAFAKALVPGRPLAEVPPNELAADFFRQLSATLAALHARGIAYVDLDKPQNVIVDPAGRPWLIDFQISFDAASLPGPLGRRVLALAARGDRYHLLKHKRRFRPELLSEAERAELEKRAWFIRLHRALVRPWKALRRPLFRRLRSRGKVMPEMSR